MPRYFLLTDKEVVVHAFDSADNNAARQIMKQKAKQDRAQYTLAGAIRKSKPIYSQAVDDSTDEPV